jgi:tartrate dehydrogenase/decarboxylase/D-malate dehydrogenase
MMPDDGLDQIRNHDAIYLGAVGFPGVPDHVSLWGLLIPIRRAFQQYVNLRPCRLMPGVTSPLAGREPGDIDFYVVRENTEGEYSSVGGRMFEGVPCPLAGREPGDIDFLIVRENCEGEYSEMGGRIYAGTDQEMAIQESIFTRHGVDRILRYAFELARTRQRRHLTSATKSNGIIHTMPFWDERFRAIKAAYPEVSTDQYHIDILTAHFVRFPDRFDVVVGSNLFGDILSDLGPAVTGTIGIAPSANINPERRHPSMFEPVHGSAPDIAGQGIANPIGQIWSGAMMLDHLGHQDAAAAIVGAIERVLAAGTCRTPDMGGKATTEELGKAIEREI